MLKTYHSIVTIKYIETYQSSHIFNNPFDENKYYLVKILVENIFFTSKSRPGKIGVSRIS